MTGPRPRRRSVRLEAPAGLGEGVWHFYDVSFTMQAHAAGLANLALPLGLRHASTGRTDAAWEAARQRLRHRLAPLLPVVVPDTWAAPLATGEAEVASARRPRYALLLCHVSGRASPHQMRVSLCVAASRVS